MQIKKFLQMKQGKASIEKNHSRNLKFHCKLCTQFVKLQIVIMDCPVKKMHIVKEFSKG